MTAKEMLKTELLVLLRAELASAEKAHRSTTEGATHEEAKPENDKDTRALEQSYLARGQALRVEELRAGVAELEALVGLGAPAGGRVALGACVVVEDDVPPATTYWIAPHGGGSRLADGTVQVVTPRSPLGRALIGKAKGDEAELAVAGKKRVITIVSVE